MFAFLGISSVLSFIIFLVILLLNIIKKRSKKKALLGLGGSLIIFIIALAITPTGSESSQNTINTKGVTKEINLDKKNKPEKKLSQEELNIRLKKEAVKAEFIELNSNSKSNINKKVYLEGTVGTILKDGVLGEFSVNTKEENGYGIYTILNMHTTEKETLKQGDIIKIYGVYDGKEKDNIPKITAIIIEKIGENKEVLPACSSEKANVKSYPSINSNDYSLGSPKRIVAEYVTCWKNQNWKNMLNFSEIAWLSREKDPTGVLAAQYDFKILLGSEILDEVPVSDVASKVRFKVYYKAFSDNVEVKEITAMVIREDSMGNLSRKGKWGVNPVSTLGEQNSK